MESKKPNNISDEDLLKILSSEKSNAPTELEDSILNFISFFNIEDGKHRVKLSLLHKLYRGWCKPPQLPHSNFNRRLMSIFRHSGQTADKYILINKNNINISKELYNFLFKKSIVIVNEPKTKAHINAFFNYYKINSGKIWKEATILYYLYDKWTFDNKTRILSRKVFNKILNVYFEHKYIFQNGLPTLVYRINSDLIDILPKDHQKQIIDGRAKNIERIKKQKEAKENKSKI